jgi:hypothetical protein
MIITFGKFRGRSVEWLVLNAPGYVKWVINQPAPAGPLIPLKSELLRLIDMFDAKRILEPCINCKSTAFRFTGYQGVSYELYPWCETCDCYNTGAASWKLTVIKTYRDALKFIEWHCRGRPSAYQAIIRAIAESKGFPERSSEVRIQKFFHESVEAETEIGLAA